MESVKNFILFPSYNNGLSLEAVLKKEAVNYTIVPTPRELSSCCGVAMMYEKKDEETIKKLIEKNNIQVAGFHSIMKEYKNPYMAEEVREQK